MTVNRPKTPSNGANTPLRMWGLVGRSIAGLRLYARNTGKNWSASATAYSHTQPDSYEAVYIDRSTRVAELLGLDTALEPGDLDTITGYTGDDYGIPTEGVFEAIHLVAKTEGIILDPNYTGKSMSALIGEIRAGNLDPRRTGSLRPLRRPTPNLRLRRPTLELATQLSPLSHRERGRERAQRDRRGMQEWTHQTQNPINPNSHNATPIHPRIHRRTPAHPTSAQKHSL